MILHLFNEKCKGKFQKTLCDMINCLIITSCCGYKKSGYNI